MLLKSKNEKEWWLLLANVSLVILGGELLWLVIMATWPNQSGEVENLWEKFSKTFAVNEEWKKWSRREKWSEKEFSPQKEVQKHVGKEMIRWRRKRRMEEGRDKWHLLTIFFALGTILRISQVLINVILIMS